MTLACVPLSTAPELPQPDLPDAQLTAALRLFKGGRLAEAEALCADVRSRHPQSLRALLLAAAMRSAAGDLDAVEALLTRVIDIDPGHPVALLLLAQHHQKRGNDAKAIPLFEAAREARPDFAPTENDFGISLQRVRRLAEAVAAFERAIALAPDFAAAHCNRGLVLLAMGRAEEAMPSFAAVLALRPNSAATWHALGVAQQNTGDLNQAEASFRQALALDPRCEDARIHLANLLYRRHRHEEAIRHFDDWSKSQRITIRPCTGEARVARILLIGGIGPCNTPTHFLFGAQHFETITLYLPLDAPPEGDRALLERLPPFDLCFNAIGDADCGAAFLPRVAALAHELRVPLLNPPERIAETQRDAVAARLRDIPGVIVPRTQRVSRVALEARAKTAGRCDPPTLIRPAGAHGGEDLRRIDDDDAIPAYLAEMPSDAFYLTDYFDYRSADGYFRKYRLIFIDGEIYPYHLAICEDWLAHYWRAKMFDHLDKRREEAAFLADYESVFPAPANAALKEIARRLALDYAGIDCSLTPDGRLVVFEANASMLVQLGEPIEVAPDKHAYVPRIADAMRRLVLRRLALSNREST